MDEYMLRQKLLRDGMSWGEAEEEIANRASDAYDQEQDRRAEEYFKANRPKESN